MSHSNEIKVTSWLDIESTVPTLFMIIVKTSPIQADRFLSFPSKSSFIVTRFQNFEIKSRDFFFSLVKKKVSL